MYLGNSLFWSHLESKKGHFVGHVPRKFVVFEPFGVKKGSFFEGIYLWNSLIFHPFGVRKGSFCECIYLWNPLFEPSFWRIYSFCSKWTKHDPNWSGTAPKDRQRIKFGTLGHCLVRKMTNSDTEKLNPCPFWVKLMNCTFTSTSTLYT